jgi:midasin (ATPase involved in ribosome maturation)
MLRSTEGVFSGRESYMTLRDLFRWGMRYAQATQVQQATDWTQFCADQGMCM